MSNARNLANLLNSSGVLTADAGVKADNITIDGTEIDLSSGDLTVDVAGDIILDADGSNITLKDAGSTRFDFLLDSTPTIEMTGGNFTLENKTTDAVMYFKGDDNGSGITALTLDMANAGAATFNSGITMGSSLAASGAPFTISNTSNGNNIDIKTTSSGSLVHALKIHSSGLLEAKQGVAIGGDGSANTLEDYEEGTWTPAVQFNTSGSVSYSRQDGSYTKVGRMIFIDFALIFTTSSPNGVLQMTGFPFAHSAVATSSNDRGVLNLGYIDNINAEDFTFLMDASGSQAEAYRYNGSDKDSTVTNSHLAGGSVSYNFHGSGVYKTST